MQEKDNNVYRSSDDKVIAGVCSGISHKLNFSKWGLRFAFIVGAWFFGITILAYIICWMVFKPRPTFNR
ncbi:MAG: PspC domain-containing protein [Proteobacteria bacterium]|jgi:phage shock protein PspC (stress-responsive transcriptional regulator)|nr:PspC domain-containing protein [Candidatus Fonsibacter sp. PEL4]NBZ97896.1 PspC domain-containing protein [Candidatus Fonsibacter sp. PEL4]